MEKKKYRKFIGPSQFGTILGYDEYCTPEKFRDEIENGYVQKSSYACQFGIDSEEIAIKYYQSLLNHVISKPKFVVDKNNKHIGGICDGIIDEHCGLEIKCHISDKNLLSEIPKKYLIQMTGYMYLYGKTKWILMSCVLNVDNTIKNHKIFEVNWSDVKDIWESDWYPKILQFAQNLKWH